jgi:3-oxoadipate enol-lactonase
VHARGDGAPLLLLHCLGVDRHFWDFAAELAGEFRLLSFDLPGHGETPVPNTSYGIDDLAELAADLVHREGIPRAHVAGISLGGLIAQRLAAAYPELVDRLMLIDTTPRYSDELRTMWAVRAKGAREHGVRSLIDGLLPIWFMPEAIADDTAAVRYVRATLARCPGEGYALACEALAKADLRGDAAGIRAPTLVVCGDEDIPSFLDAARWLGANIAGAKIAWIARARHASVLERPEEALRLLRDFLA